MAQRLAFVLPDLEAVRVGGKLPGCYCQKHLKAQVLDAAAWGKGQHRDEQQTEGKAWAGRGQEKKIQGTR